MTLGGALYLLTLGGAPFSQQTFTNFIQQAHCVNKEIVKQKKEITLGWRLVFIDTRWRTMFKLSN